MAGAGTGAVVPLAPIATRVPSEDIDTEPPDWSPQPRRRCLTPPGSTSRCSQRTRARGRRTPVPSFLSAPIATRVPSEDMIPTDPDSSPAASPSMSEPTWVHVPPLSAYTRTWPASCRCRRSVSADRHARAVRGHRYRVPGLVVRSLAVDV